MLQIAIFSQKLNQQCACQCVGGRVYLVIVVFTVVTLICFVVPCQSAVLASRLMASLVEVEPLSNRTLRYVIDGPDNNIKETAASKYAELFEVNSNNVNDVETYTLNDIKTGGAPISNDVRNVTSSNLVRFEQWPSAIDVAPSLQQRLPQVIIIGVKKGGTRALLEFLRIHPDVRAVGPEVHFFDKYYDRGLNWYRSKMPFTEERQLTIEKTPSYFITSRVVERIRQMSPDVRLIVVLRDPVSRALSDYAQARTKRPALPAFEKLAFRDAVNDIRSLPPDRGGVSGSSLVNVSSSSYGEVNASWRAIQIGLYAVHLRRWMTHFRRDRIHFVSGERLVADPAGTIFDVQRFLGLSRSITEMNFRTSVVKPGFPCLVRDPIRSPSVLHCLGKTKGRRHPLVDVEALERLRNFFRPYNEELHRITGIDFGWP